MVHVQSDRLVLLLVPVYPKYGEDFDIVNDPVLAAASQDQHQYEETQNDRHLMTQRLIQHRYPLSGNEDGNETPTKDGGISCDGPCTGRKPE
ncbi:hypothetical protein D3C81_1863650 [compost metagenome]